MKLRTFILIILCWVVLATAENDGRAQGRAGVEKVSYLEPGYYIIVGAFELEKGAISYAEKLKKSGNNSVRYGFYPPKSIYYVHMGRYQVWRKSWVDLNELRKNSEFEDAWVFKAEPYSMPAEPEVIAKSTAEESEEIVNAEKDSLEVAEVTEPIDDDVKEGDVEEEDDDIMGVMDMTGGVEGEDYFLYFKVVRKDNGKRVDGQVEIIDPDQLKRVKFAEAHANEFIPKSFNRSGNVEMICEIFGYKKVQHDFNINRPFSEMTEPFLSLRDTRLVVEFELERLTVGDLVTMYNVYFYKDAAIMRPESKYELTQLVEMLKENPEYEIMIHGHTNGNNSGPIITLKEGSKQFFTKSAPTDEKRGSAKKLSQARADAILNYLINEGIDESRMKAKGWGGKRAIYKKFDPLAYKNVRVEIEILVD